MSGGGRGWSGVRGAGSARGLRHRAGRRTVAPGGEPAARSAAIQPVIVTYSGSSGRWVRAAKRWLQMAGRSGQAQRFAGFTGLALGFLQQPAADAALAGELAYAQVRQAPGVVAALQQGGAEQAVIEAPGDQAAIGQRRGDQRVGAGIGRQQPVRCIGVDFRQVGKVLRAGLGDGFDVDGHGDLATAGRNAGKAYAEPPPAHETPAVGAPDQCRRWRSCRSSAPHDGSGCTRGRQPGAMRSRGRGGFTSRISPIVAEGPLVIITMRSESSTASSTSW